MIVVRRAPERPAKNDHATIEYTSPSICHGRPDEHMEPHSSFSPSHAADWMRTSTRALLDRLRRLPTKVWIEVSLLAAIFTYGSLLRFEAFQRSYGPLLGSSWWIRLQGGVADLVQLMRPESFAWARADMPYRFDAKSYIGSARAMDHFYEAQLREPLFVFATKVGLWLTGGQDIAVSMMSSLFSALIIVATYALGRSIGGAAVGLLGALFIAIERQMIWTGTAGYRDDLFTLLTVLFACGCIRLLRRPSLPGALVTGVIGGFANLTRITSLSFVLPGLFVVALSRGIGGARQMLRPAIVSGLIAVMLLAPFLVTSWMEFGDPLYSINWATSWYRTRGGLDGSEDMTAGAYLVNRLRDEPGPTLHTGLRGFTIYPWANKWTGFSAHWGGPFGSALKWLSVAGVLMWIWVPAGRMALLVFAASMLPFAFTWEVRGGAQWRFTMHAYPFLLAAAAYALVEVTRAARRLMSPAALDSAEMRTLGNRFAVTAAVVFLFFATLSVLTPLAVAHDLSRGRPASVGGSEKDELLFGAGWKEMRQDGNITFHYPYADRGTIWVPMSGERAYVCLIRLDALPETGDTPRIMELTVNGRWAQRLTLHPDAGNVGRQEFRIPAGVVRSGLNRIDLVDLGTPRGETPDQDVPSGPRFRFWYIRFFPQPR